MEALSYILVGALMMLALALLRGQFADFGAQRPEDYASDPNQIDLRKHLEGAIKCDGVIYGPTGRVVSRFTGDFMAKWQGNRGVMQERFDYDSGNSQDREWRLELGNDGSIRAEADDLVGMGHGRQLGSAAQLCYRIRLPKEAGGHVLSVTDWMYLTPNGAVVNRSQFRKFGIKVAELVATMRRVDA